MSETFDHGSWVPGVPFLRAFEIAALLLVTDKHIISLIREGAIKVPKKLQESAQSGPAMRVPRESVVAFVRQRSSTNPNRKKPAARKRAKGKGAV